MGDQEILPMTDPSAAATPAPAPEISNTIFRGPNGIRAGWRVLIFLVLVAAVVVAL